MTKIFKLSTLAAPILLLSLPASIQAAELIIGDTASMSGNWATAGNVTATSFTGNGSGLSNVSAVGLACVNCIGTGHLNFTPGTITGIVANSGLIGGGSIGEVALSVAPGGIGAVHINSAEVQARITGTCTETQYIQAINQNGSVTCRSAAAGGGGITQIDTGTGLTGGPITTSGTISVAFEGTGSATTVSRSDHNHDSLYQKKYAKRIVVAQSGGDFYDLYSAMNSITDASETNRYQVKIMPGTYNLSASPGSTVRIKQYVDIEGSGTNNTKITSTNALYGVVIADGYNQISSLSLESLNTSYAWAEQGSGMYILGPGVSVTDANVNLLSDYDRAYTAIKSSTSAQLNNVTVNASGNSHELKGLELGGIDNLIQNVRINVTSPSTAGSMGYGIYQGSGRVNNLNINITGPGYGVYAASGSYSNVTVNANSSGQYALRSGQNLDILSSTFNGSVVGGGGGYIMRLDSSVVNGYLSAEDQSFVKVGHSRVSYITPSGGRIKVVNSSDSNFDPITNQSY